MSLKTEESENEKRWLVLRAKISEENIKTAFRIFRENGVEPILIKGWAAAREYPESYRRFSVDIDLCVAPENYEKGRALIETNPGNTLSIDLHKGLRHLDSVGWNQLFENSELVQIDDVGVRILRAEDHLRILCVHWLTDGGAEKEKLLDIYYLLQNKNRRFDWEYCFRSIDPNRRDWIIKTVVMVNKYYKLDVSELPFAVELDSVPEWFYKALEREWASGTRLRSIFSYYENREEFWRQIKKRLRPNPIQSTVFMEGRFDRSPRIFYQVGSFLKRLKPAIPKALNILKDKLRKT